MRHRVLLLQTGFVGSYRNELKECRGYEQQRLLEMYSGEIF